MSEKPYGMKQFRADLRLADAAPDLLAACKQALGRLEWIEYGLSEPRGDVIAQLKAAIAKAEGREGQDR